jgi:hypothetical protein
MRTNKTYKVSLMVSLTAILVLISSVMGVAQMRTQAELIAYAKSQGIEESRLISLQARIEERGMSEEALRAILTPAIEMAQNNLPYEMIFEKAFEGFSKGIPHQRILPVLESIKENAFKSSQIVDQWVARPEVDRMVARSRGEMNSARFRDEMVKAGTKAYSQNFSGEVLSQTLNSISERGILNNAQPSGILAAINIIGDLPQASENPGQASLIVLRALEGGFNANDMQKLPSAMNTASRRSQLPASAVAEGFGQQLQGGTPAAQILQNLFNGNIVGGPPTNRPYGVNRGRPSSGNGS